MADEPVSLLPELARSLRVLGTPRDDESEAAHAAVFAPLLGARARAARADVAGVLAALRGREVMSRIEVLTRAAAEKGVADAARMRARVAASAELLEPLRAEFAELDRVAAIVNPAAGVETPDWEAWVAQLRRVFAVADVACGNLASMLAGADRAPARRWFGGAGKGRSK